MTDSGLELTYSEFCASIFNPLTLEFPNSKNCLKFSAIYWRNGRRETTKVKKEEDRSGNLKPTSPQGIKKNKEKSSSSTWRTQFFWNWLHSYHRKWLRGRMWKQLFLSLLKTFIYAALPKRIPGMQFLEKLNKTVLRFRHPRHQHCR